MPWRGTRDPYRIWVSEVMLQQTRVAAVIPFYQKFLKKFPTVGALARARQSEVLRLWAGLGYYSRARNLHCAAKLMVAKYGGTFPRDAAAALALPGVGKYTAAAVLSIAYGQPVAVLDGNVARVLARVHGLRGELKQHRHWLRLEALAQKYMDGAVAAGNWERESGKRGKSPARPGPAQRMAGIWNQALMELGATVCTPRSPNCPECPVARWCRARRLGLEAKIPPLRHRPATVRMTIAAAVFADRRNRILLIRPAVGNCAEIFSRMWQFPAVQVQKNARRELLVYLEDLFDGAARNLQPLAHTRHAVTYRDIQLIPFLARLHTLPEAEGARVVSLQQLDSLPISSATRKIARAALEHLRDDARETA